MTLSSAGAIANQSLGAIATRIDVVSRNISGASIAGYTTKTALVSTEIGGGVRVDGVARATNAALFRNSLQATSAEAAASSVSAGLDQIDRALNISSATATDADSNRSPAALLSKLSNALQSYSAAPSDRTAAQAVLAGADALVRSLNDATAAVQDVRQTADDGVASSVADINAILSEFRQVNSDIVAGSQAGRDVAESLDKRDQLLTKLSAEIGVTTVTRQNNDMVVYTDSGATLFETTPRTVAFRPAGLFVGETVGNAVYVDGVPVTGSSAPMPIKTGRLQGLVELRDVVAPQFQSQLDETARGLIVAFSETDQTGASSASAPGLFTFPGATATPAVGVIPGLAGRIAVNANADPAQGGNLDLLRDGGISNPADPAFRYNVDGAAGYSTRIEQLIASLSSTQDFDANAGLSPRQSLNDYAVSSVGWLAAQRQQATKTASYQSTLLSQTSQALSNATGVNLDDQMSKMLDLENSYQASAKLLATVDAMYSALFQAL